MHQARFTREQGRVLYVILPDPLPEGFNPAGARILMEGMGAIPLASSSGLTEALAAATGNDSPAVEEPADRDDSDGEQLGLFGT